MIEKGRLNDWLSLLANVAVVAGIVFLGFELRQNNALLRADASHVMLENRTTNISELFRNPQLAVTYVKAGNGEELSDLDRHYLDRYYRVTFVKWQWEYEQYKSGLIDERLQPNHARAFVEWPYLLEYWESSKASLRQDFIEHVETNYIQ